MNDVAVIICNYNKKDYVLDCIESVFKSAFSRFDLIVVDNASTDGSAEAINARFGDKLTLLVNEENTGGSGGFNCGMRLAMDKGCYKYVHLLDNDVIADKDAIGELYRFMESRPEVGACGSLIYRFDDPTFTQEMGALIDYKNLGYKALYSKQRNPDPPTEIECDYIAFCSAMLRMESLQKTGLMPVEYFIYWDDMELCWRIRRFGYKVCAISDSFVFHHANAIAPTTTFARYYYFRNMLNCFVRHLDDHEFEQLSDLVVERLYRIFAVNRNNSDLIATYMHSLNDALNGVGGKAAENRIFQFQSGAVDFFNLFTNTANSLIFLDCDFRHIGDLISGIQKVSNNNITVVTNGYEAGDHKNIKILHTVDNLDKYELCIQTCSHILDLAEYDHNLVYIDNYWNSIITQEDFNHYTNFRQGYNFFHATHHQFIKDKLSELRKRVRIISYSQTGEDNA